MKIAILSSFYPYRGGIAQFNANLYRELGRSNEVIAFNFKRQYPAILFPGKTQYIEKEDPAVRIDSEVLLDTVNPLSFITTARRIRECAPDLLLMRYWMPWFAPSLGYVSGHQHEKTKVISILDNVIPHERRFFDKAFTKYFLKGSDAFIVLSESVGKELTGIKPDAKFICIPHPVYNHFPPGMDRGSAEEVLGIEKGKRNILFFGLIRDYKGLDVLIEAFSSLDQRYQLIIAGEPYGSFDRYREQIEKLNNKDRVKIFTRYIPDSEVPLFFSASDVCVLPYKSATQSGISSISFHYNLPMITTSAGGLRESIEKPGAGLVTGSADPAEIRSAVEKFFDSGLSPILIDNIKRYKASLSWESFAQKLIGFYQTLK
ncbi:MAG: glycosyltransferase [Bacteroidales bacterium]|nr:glycosyltransferase [Bacteroidales bacterium]MDD3988843.1 glycosyltransferase [Bacteroidales bacterium]